jgi:hypothetical protein
MVQIVERAEAHYEAREVPFGRVYECIRHTLPLSAPAARG